MHTKETWFRLLVCCPEVMSWLPVFGRRSVSYERPQRKTSLHRGRCRPQQQTNGLCFLAVLLYHAGCMQLQNAKQCSTCRLGGSNTRPFDLQSNALPTELSRRCFRWSTGHFANPCCDATGNLSRADWLSSNVPRCRLCSAHQTQRLSALALAHGSRPRARTGAIPEHHRLQAPCGS